MPMVPAVAHDAQITAIKISPAGNLQLAGASQQAPLFHRGVANSTFSKAQKTAAEAVATSTGGLAAGILSQTAAAARTGARAHAVPGRPSRQVRSEASKPLPPMPIKTIKTIKSTSWLPQSSMGAVLQVAARTFSAVGLVVQRSVRDDDTNVLLWWVGLGTYMSSVIPDLLSYLLAPLNVLTALSSVEPVLAVALATVLLPGDLAHITSQHSLATLLCVAGTLGFAFFAPSAPSALDMAPKDILQTARGSARLFQPAGWHRFMVYFFFAAALLIYLAREFSIHKKTMTRGFSSQISCLYLPALAAISLALQRLALGMLGVSLDAVQWGPWQAFLSPGILLQAGLVVVCVFSCGYHVCQGVVEAPPHIFVPVYFAMSSLLQLFQSMAIMRDFEDEPAEKVVCILGCAAISLFGIFRLCTSSEPYRLSKLFARQGRGQAAVSRHHHQNCLEPFAFDSDEFSKDDIQEAAPASASIFSTSYYDEST